MLKKVLVSLVIFQGLLIVLGIIAIIFGIFYKMNNNDNLSKIINKNIDLNNIYLINENEYQQKLILEDKVIIKIIDIETNKIKKIVIEKIKFIVIAGSSGGHFTCNKMFK